jgi:hypothetical protein
LGNVENRAVGMHTHTVFDPGHSHGLEVKGDAFVVGFPNVAAGNTGAPTRRLFTSFERTGISVNAAGTVGGTNAPYLQLLVCQKN